MGRRRHNRPRKKGRGYHHLKARSRGGDDTNANLLLIRLARHDDWHKVFGRLDLDEVIELLIRLRMMKRRREVKHGRVRAVQAGASRPPGEDQGASVGVPRRVLFSIPQDFE